MAASILNWEIVDPYKGLNESDSKLYTNFEFCENIMMCLKKSLFTQPSNLCCQNQSKKLNIF